MPRSYSVRTADGTVASACSTDVSCSTRPPSNAPDKPTRKSLRDCAGFVGRTGRSRTFDPSSLNLSVAEEPNGPIEVPLNNRVVALQPLDHTPGSTGTLPICGEAITSLPTFTGSAALPWRSALAVHDGGRPLIVILGS